MTRLAAIFAAALAAHAAGPVKVGPFTVDATPPLGEPLIWTTPAERVLDPLLAKGVVLEANGKRYVMCAVDWCGIGGEIHHLLRAALARGAGADPEAVELHVVHQHTAPYLEGDGYKLLAAAAQPPLLYSWKVIEDLARRLEAAAGKARQSAVVVDQIGLGSAKVERVASARRLVINGKHATRVSTAGKSKIFADAPEGQIDPVLRTITLARAGNPVVRLHYYATHPQTFCCEGTVTADFVGTAREKLEGEDRVPQIYFTGAAGNVTVGKYNDETVEKRRGLETRLLAGLRASIASTQYEPIGGVRWKTAKLSLPIRKPDDPQLKIHQAKLPDVNATGAERYRGAIGVAFNRKVRPIDVSALFIGRAAIVHLPGEPLLEFQLYAQSQAKDKFVAVAGYGDIAPGYVCPDIAFKEGGYEPSASNAAPGSEAAMQAIIRELLR